MNNNRFGLPGVNSVNWGSSLNVYIESLERRLKRVEEEFQTNSLSVVKNIGYAGSGIVGNDGYINISYENGQWNTTIEGGKLKVFFGGDINTYYELTTDSFIDGGISTIPTGADNAYYIILSIEYKDNPEFKIRYDTVFEENYYDILLGYLYDQKFTPVVYSSLKTNMQHAYERSIRSVDLDTYGNAIEITIDQDFTITPLLKGNIFNLLLDGVGIGNNSKFYSTNKLDKATVSVSGRCYRIWDDEVSWNIDTTDNCTNSGIYRLLLTVHGDLILQKSNFKGDIPNKNPYQAQQFLYNTSFCNYLYKEWQEGNITKEQSLLATEYVEICRFGFNGSDLFSDSASSYTYTQNAVIANPNFFFVKALDKGVAYQQAMNIWAVQTGTVTLDNTVFKNNANEDDDFNFYYHSNKSDMDYYDRILINSTLKGDSGAPLLFAHTDMTRNNVDGWDILEGEHNIAPYKDIFLKGIESKLEAVDSLNLYSTGDIDILGSSDISLTSLEGEVFLSGDNGIRLSGECAVEGLLKAEDGIQIAEGKVIEYTSDRRRKERFSPIAENYLDVVNNTPVLNYYYKNSDKQQVGIIAQDLEQSLKKNIDVFVSIQETPEFKDKRSLAETKLVYILWKALQEESELRKKLEERINSLESK